MLTRVRRFPPMRHLQEAVSCTIPLFMPSILISLLTTSCQVFAGLPLPLLPSTFKNLYLITQSDSSFLSKCPNHHKRPILATSKTFCIPGTMHAENYSVAWVFHFGHMHSK